MTDQERMTLAADRKLIFTNLANSVPMRQVMAAFGRSEKEVMAEFEFVAKKIRSYRFERGMPFAACMTIRDAQKNAALLLHTLERLNLSTEPKFAKVETLPFDMATGRVSQAEAKLLEMRMKAR
jgi:hypothetical protein